MIIDENCKLGCKYVMNRNITREGGEKFMKRKFAIGKILDATLFGGCNFATSTNKNEKRWKKKRT